MIELPDNLKMRDGFDVSLLKPSTDDGTRQPPPPVLMAPAAAPQAGQRWPLQHPFQPAPATMQTQALHHLVLWSPLEYGCGSVSSRAPAAGGARCGAPPPAIEGKDPAEW